jgi:hypothetical protein
VHSCRIRFQLVHYTYLQESKKNHAQLRIPHPARKSLLAVPSCHTGHCSKSRQLFVYDIPPPHSPHKAKWLGVSYTELQGAPLRAGPVLETRLSLTSVVFLAAQATLCCAPCRKVYYPAVCWGSVLSHWE